MGQCLELGRSCGKNIVSQIRLGPKTDFSTGRLAEACMFGFPNMQGPLADVGKVHLADNFGTTSLPLNHSVLTLLPLHRSHKTIVD